MRFRITDSRNYSLPNLLGVSRISFCTFLEKGLCQEVEDFLPIYDPKREVKLSLSSRHYKIRCPRYSFRQAKIRASTYSISVLINAKLDFLVENMDVDKKVYVNNIPLMTNTGSFLINGVEWIIVNQITRCPGVYYSNSVDTKGNLLYTAKLIADRGSWFKFEINSKDEFIYFQLDKYKKLSAYSLLLALGITDKNLSDHFKNNEYFQRTVGLSRVKSLKDAFLDVCTKLKPGSSKDWEERGQELLYSMFFDPNRYSLGYVGRFKLNEALQLKIKKTVKVLTIHDIFQLIDRLVDFRCGRVRIDDIDHLENRRVRSSGELIQNQIRIGLSRLRRLSLERIKNPSDRTINKLIQTNVLTSPVREFFASSPLSQFLQQTNPLSVVTHKRRVSALGPGGISKDQARSAVREIHPSQYGRICTIDTPEGPNTGLVGTLASYAAVNSYGFLKTPFYKISNCQISSYEWPIYLGAMEEEKFYLGFNDSLMDPHGLMIADVVSARFQREFVDISPEDIEYSFISPSQFLSVATALTPFLEHDDATRILMGSSMQRQAVPLLHPELPLVGTGLEPIVAQDSDYLVISRHSGKIKNLSQSMISIMDQDGNIIRYKLAKYQRSNQETSMNHQSLVSLNEKVFKGQILADGAATQNGELAVGKNILIAYAMWLGYNFEDAFVVSDRLVREDVFTSLHIEKLEVEVRDTGEEFGRDEITRDIPFISESAIRNLDENGIVNIGTWVDPHDIIVGKVTPQDPSSETGAGKLLRAIFGTKNRGQDTSLRAPRGLSGRILDTKLVSTLGHFGELDKIVVLVAQVRKIHVGDKMAGRHGNKGVISQILPVEDMPFLPDGEPVDILLNPLGVPSRMNIGQLFESLLGLAADNLNVRFKVASFDERDGPESSRALIYSKLLSACSNGEKPWLVASNYIGKAMLRDGLSGKYYDNPVTIGVAYMLKLIHLVDDKMHARSTGPYSIITQQPVRGRSKKGGQRFGEMEVWALEAYGAAFNLRELLTIKSDDMEGRNKTLDSIVKGNRVPRPNLPESFKVFVRELRGLCLEIKGYSLNSVEDRIGEQVIIE